MKHILVTNIDYIFINNLMLHAHAMLIDDQLDNPKYKRCTLRGFGTDPSWPVFQIHLKSGVTHAGMPRTGATRAVRSSRSPLMGRS